MSFFDSKTEVLNIELTPYGRELFSRGKWKPTYYEFYDDDVIYESQFGGFTEGQDKIQQRIAETPREKTQFTFKERSAKEERESFSQLISLPLANSSFSSKYYPSWDVNIYRGDISSLSYGTSPSGIPNNIYKINLDTIHYKLSVKQSEDITNAFYEDGTFIDVKDDYLFFDFQEKNVDFLKENFDVYMYEVQIDKDGNEIEVPIPFDPDLPLDIDAVPPSGLPPLVPPPNVGTIFDFLGDGEVDKGILRERLTKRDRDNLARIPGFDDLLTTSGKGKRIPGKLPVADRRDPDEEIC